MSKAIDIPIVILGGGPMGLGAAWALQERGRADWQLFEAASELGGLAKSFLDDRGFTWDVGGHVVFSHYDVFTQVLDRQLAGQWLFHDRQCQIRCGQSWVPYPFQNNIHHLPPDQCAACLEGLQAAQAVSGDRSSRQFRNFGQLINGSFGRGIAGLFMRPYNRKVWACEPEEMDVGWIGERVSVPDASRVAQNVAQGRDDVGWGPNNRFRFPRQGGTGAIWQAIAAALSQDKIHLGQAATKIDPDRREVTFADGRVVRYGWLITSMPLDELARLTGRGDWIRACAGLRRTSVTVIGVGLEGKCPEFLEQVSWMYFADADIPFYRVTHFSRYSPRNVPDASHQWSLMAEVSRPGGAMLDLPCVIDQTIDGLARCGLIEGKSQVGHVFTYDADYGYPIPALGRDAILKKMLPELERCGILSRGRFGAWKYEVGNMDHCFMQGYEAARRIADGSEEITLHRPEVVNKG